MLQKPGSSSSTTPRTARSSSKQIQESPDDMIRKLARLPSNKKCCDCTSKLPNSVNVTLGIFLCPTCAGIHRELPSNPRIKGIGHTIFTKEEVDMIQTIGGNERVNAIYLGNYHPSQERMKPPMDNTDVHILRNWILRKYKDKTWYRNGAAAADASTSTSTTTDGGGRGRSGPTTHSTTSTKGNKNERGVAGMMRQPTVVSNIPPKQPPPSKAATAVPDMVDLFDTGPTTTSTTTNNNNDSEWDAFSTSRSNAVVDDFANFDTVGMVSPPPPPNTGGGTAAAAAPISNPSFGNFDTPTTMKSGQPQAHLQQPPNQFANFPLTEQNDSNNNNHNSFMPHQVPQQQQQPVPMQSPNNDFGSFPELSGNSNSNSNSGGFANFDSIATTTTQHFPAQQQIPMVPTQQQQQEQPAAFDKFDAFDSLQISSTNATTNDGSLNMMNNNSHSNTVAHTFNTNSNNNATVAPSVTNVLKMTKFQSGQKVYYKSSSYSGPVEILKVHFDDALEPFYTIALTDGKEKQTDDAHLSHEMESMNQMSHDDSRNNGNTNTNNSNETSAFLGEIQNLLSNLSMEQLIQVKQFILQTTNTNMNGTLPPLSSFSSMTANAIPTNHPPLDMSMSQSIPPGMTTTNVIPQQVPRQPQSIPPGQLSHMNFSMSPMPPPPQISPLPEASSIAGPVATVSQPQPIQAVPQQDQQGSFDMPSMNGTTIPQPQSTMAANGVSSTGMMMGTIGSTTMNGPPGAINSSNSSDAFGGIPSPDMGVESKPSVTPMSSIPPPPLIQPQQMPQPSTMINPTQSHIYNNMPQQSSSMMTMNQMPQQQDGFGAPQHQMPTMMMNSTMGQPTPQINTVVPQQQQQHQPMNQQQGLPGANDQAPLSPLSPKGNPFDFY